MDRIEILDILDQRIEELEEERAPLAEKTRSFIRDFNELTEIYNRKDAIDLLLGELKTLRTRIEGG